MPSHRCPPDWCPVCEQAAEERAAGIGESDERLEEMGEDLW